MGKDGGVGLIQIDMPMPYGCSECRFETARGFCKAMPDNFCGFTNDEGKPDWCPLKEQKPKTGHWIFESKYCEAWSHTCSECGKRMTTAVGMYASFCWNCGAKMTGGEADADGETPIPV